jgi:Ser-tRNA(Ala) deacylase AlaX
MMDASDEQSLALFFERARLSVARGAAAGGPAGKGGKEAQSKGGQQQQQQQQQKQSKQQPPTKKAPSAPALAPLEGAPTERIYLSYAGNFQLECIGAVVACRVTPPPAGADADAGSTVELAFDQSVFHPQGGGQPTDVGSITNPRTGATLNVDKCSFDFGTRLVTHQGTMPAAEAAAAFAVGDAGCALAVDAATRERYSRCHTAGHMVDSAMVRAGYSMPPTKGYHFLDGPYVEYKGTVAVEEREALVAKLKVEFEALREEDIATTIEMLPKDEAEARLNRTQKNFDFSVFTDPDVRVVGVAGFECPCGGTHVRSSKDCEHYTVTGMRVKKGIVRIKYGAVEN